MLPRLFQEYKYFLEKRLDYYDDNKAQGNIEPEGIARPVRRRTNSECNASDNNANGDSKFSYGLIIKRDLVGKTREHNIRNNIYMLGT